MNLKTLEKMSKGPKEKILKPTWGKISSEELLKFSSENIIWDFK